ncbi:unnamed protein product [Urochloa humidicola]
MAHWSSSHAVAMPPPLQVAALMKHPSPSPGTDDAAAELSATRYTPPRSMIISTHKGIELTLSILAIHGREMGVEETLPGTTGFILDSGAAVHATASSELITDPSPPPQGGVRVFRTRTGKDLALTAVGSIATPRFAVPDVHHVPGIGHGRTLISVRQLARRGLAVTFGGESCIVKEQSTGAVVGEGRLREEDGFYYLDHLRVPPPR